MSTHHLSAILLTLLLLHLPLNKAQHLRAQAHPPHTTLAPLLIRQDIIITTCGAGATSCHDGGPGCCNIGAACTFTTNNIPICLQDCSGSDIICTGIMNGLCCEFGYTCDYQSTRCLSSSFGFVPPVFSPASLPSEPQQTPLPQASVTAAAPSSPTVQSPVATAASATPTAIPPTASPQSSSSAAAAAANTPTYNPISYLPTNPLLESSSTTSAPASASASAQFPSFFNPNPVPPTVTVTTTSPRSGQSKLTHTLTFTLRTWLAACGLGYLCDMWG